MINLDHPTLPLIKEALPEAKLFATEFRGQTTLIVERDVLHGLLKFLRDDERTRYDLLSDIAGIDYLRYPKPKDAPEGLPTGRFGVVYNLVATGTDGPEYRGSVI